MYLSINGLCYRECVYRTRITTTIGYFVGYTHTVSCRNMRVLLLSAKRNKKRANLQRCQ